MTPWIALLRGINVGGNNKLAMKDLTTLLHGLGCTGVKTYIQSGNVALLHPSDDRATLARSISAAIAQHHGFAPSILLLPRNALEQALAANPFPEREREPKSLHLFFLDEPLSAPDLTTLEGLRMGSERFALIGSCLYLLAPEGIGRSKLAAKAERALGVAATARNWNTCLQLREMAQALV